MNNFTPEIRLCTGICGRMTRNSRHLKKDFPDTVSRQRDGKCRWCLHHEHEAGAAPAERATPTSGLQPCRGICGRLTRHCRVRLADAPESVTRVRDGKCQWCLDHGDEENAQLPPRTGRPPRKTNRPVSEANVQQAAAEYAAYTAARNARLARREQRERASIQRQLLAARGQLLTAGSRRA
ncbi:hypothetical protein SEA_PUREGLOBE5_71 [Arthrobacter phage Pureglobe5]|nr:hypothetical protein SEA_ODYSSEY395_73 [Arthrobacter phage Odyssey395]UYL87434.1 hypothetical protein SEA_PUREGLOBE5_71 [Arthrobacter phage Pureglobe5]